MSFPLNNGLRNFCFCMSLRTGSRVISSITMFVCSLHLLTIWMKFTVYHARGIYCKREGSGFEKYGGFQQDDNRIPPSLRCPSTNSYELFMIVFESLVYLLGFLSSVLLMYAIKTKQPRLFLSWMMFSGMVLFTTFFYVLFWRQPRYVVTNCLAFLIQFYFFGVVSSYHQQLVDEQMGVDPPVVAIALPRNSRAGRTRADFELSDPEPRYDPTKFDPPPPYPGLPTDFDTNGDPPAYSLCNPDYTCIPPVTDVEGGNLHIASNEQGESRNASHGSVVVIPLHAPDVTIPASSTINTPEIQPNDNVNNDEINVASGISNENDNKILKNEIKENETVSSDPLTITSSTN